jgi:hypothetical protein
VSVFSSSDTTHTNLRSLDDGIRRLYLVYEGGFALAVFPAYRNSRLPRRGDR